MAKIKGIEMFGNWKVTFPANSADWLNERGKIKIAFVVVSNLFKNLYTPIKLQNCKTESRLHYHMTEVQKI